MKLCLKLILPFCFCLSLQAKAQKNIRVASPDGNIVFTFRLDNKIPQYAVIYMGKPIIDYSNLSLVFDDGRFESNLKLNKPVYTDTTEEYDLIVGKTSRVHTHYKAVIIPLEETITPFRKIDLEVKVFDDGLGFRYNFPQQNKNFLHIA
jgi:alpha-glucosidase